MPIYARLWIDILSDPKLLRAADEGAKNLVVLPWLIAWAKRADASGRIETSGKPSNPREIARAIPNVSARVIGKSLQELEAIHILDRDEDGCYRFISWEYRNSGRASDSKEAVADRVRRHRDKRRQQRTENENRNNAPTGNVSNALHDTDVTSKRVESREERGESKRESRDTSGVVRRDSLPPAALEFGRRFYGSAPLERQRDVKRQLRATLNGGASFRRGVKVLARSAARLEAKCREVIAEGVTDPDKAIVVLLTKLGDVSDDSPTDRAAADEKREELEYGKRVALADAWLADHPGIAQEIEQSIDAKLPEVSRRILRTAALLSAWTNAGEPTVQPVGAP